MIALGADEVIDYRTEHFEDRVKDVDLVLDFVGPRWRRPTRSHRPESGRFDSRRDFAHGG